MYGVRIGRKKVRVSKVTSLDLLHPDPPHDRLGSLVRQCSERKNSFFTSNTTSWSEFMWAI
jgi:hypothetical protein